MHLVKPDDFLIASAVILNAGAVVAGLMATLETTLPPNTAGFVLASGGVFAQRAAMSMVLAARNRAALRHTAAQ